METWNVAGRYRITGEIARGAMGIVYDAVHVSGRRVALKQLHARLRTDAAVAHRFAREARTGEKLLHPHLVDVLDMGVDEAGAPFFAMERLDGITLGSYLGRGGRLALDETCAVLVPIAHAVEFLHRHALVHRDIKPSSVFLSVGGTGRLVPKLLDLGIVGQLGRDDRLHATQYIAPEHSVGTASGPLADLWSLAALFFEVLTGSVAHDLSTAERAKALAALPAPVSDAILRGLSNDPRERPESVSAFLSRIEAAAPGWRASTLPASRSRARRSRAPWALAAVGGALALIPAAVILVSIGTTSLMASSKHDVPKVVIVSPAPRVSAEPIPRAETAAHRTTSARARPALAPLDRATASPVRD